MNTPNLLSAELLEHLRQATTAREFGAMLIASVPRAEKLAVAKAARTALGRDWSDSTLQQWLSPSRHTEDFADAARARNRVAFQRWLEVPGNRDRHNVSKADWLAKRPGYHAEYSQKRCKEDPAYLLAKRLRTRISEALRGRCKVSTTIALLGCTPEELALHLEEQFEPGMTWGNYGDWHVDHIRPLASFDLANEDEQRQAFHFTNTRPLWAQDNRNKGSLWEGSRHSHPKLPGRTQCRGTENCSITVLE